VARGRPGQVGDFSLDPQGRHAVVQQLPDLRVES
jgi:hypothetical protein